MCPVTSASRRFRPANRDRRRDGHDGTIHATPPVPLPFAARSPRLASPPAASLATRSTGLVPGASLVRDAREPVLSAAEGLLHRQPSARSTRPARRFVPRTGPPPGNAGRPAQGNSCTPPIRLRSGQALVQVSATLTVPTRVPSPDVSRRQPLHEPPQVSVFMGPQQKVPPFDKLRRAWFGITQ
jgi:hypothetical protein